MNIMIIASEVDVSRFDAAVTKLTAQAEVFLREGHDVYLVAQSSGDVPNIFKNKGHFTHSKGIFQQNVFHPLCTLITELKARKIIRHKAKWADVIYQRALPTSFAGAYGKRTFGIPVVLEFNSNLLSNLRYVYPLVFRFPGISVLTERRWRTVFEKSDKIVCVSEGQTGELETIGIPIDKMTVVPNGVDVNRFYPSVGEPPMDRKLRTLLQSLEGHRVITHVGSSVFYDYDAMLSVVSKVATELNDIVLLLVGGGESQQGLEKRVQEDSTLKGLVYFAGNIPNEYMPYVLQRSHVLIWLPRQSEKNKLAGFSPVKLFEYMAMGKPIVARDDEYGSISKILCGGGIVINSSDTDEIARSIIKILQEKEMADALGRKAHQRATEYTWEKNAQSHLEIYKELIKNRQMYKE